MRRWSRGSWSRWERRYCAGLKRSRRWRSSGQCECRKSFYNHYGAGAEGLGGDVPCAKAC